MQSLTVESYTVRSTINPKLQRAAEAALQEGLARYGRPIQYAHVPEPLDLWTVQNRFSSRPWAFESPSAGRPLTWSTLRDLKPTYPEVSDEQRAQLQTIRELLEKEE